MIVLGLAGPYAAGKGEVVSFLQARGFYPLSLSDVIRDELASRGQVETRERMIETGTELRASHGPAVLAERLVARFVPDRHYVIDSIRHPAEVEALRRATSDFKLIWIDADPALRFERIRSRARPGDPGSLAELGVLEGREEAGDGNEAGQQLGAVRAAADVALENQGDLEALHAQLQRLLGGAPSSASNDRAETSPS